MNYPRSFAAGIAALAIGCQPANPPKSPEKIQIANSTTQHIEGKPFNNNIQTTCDSIALKINITTSSGLEKLCKLMVQYENGVFLWNSRAMIDEDTNIQRKRRGEQLAEVDRSAIAKMFEIAHLYYLASEIVKAAIEANSPLSDAVLAALQSDIDNAEKSLENKK